MKVRRALLGHESSVSKIIAQDNNEINVLMSRSVATKLNLDSISPDVLLLVSW